MAMTKSLVIVESPAKAKTIEKYLGKGYEVLASVGHIMDLPKNEIGVELENRTFEPTLIVSPGKEKVVSQLKKAAAKADFVSLTFFEVGLFGWMALMAFVFFPAPHPLMPNSAGYWFLMQVGMMIGFLTSWPANVWLVNRSIKVPM